MCPHDASRRCYVRRSSDHGRTTNGHSTRTLLWSNDSHRHLNMVHLNADVPMHGQCRLYNHVLSLTKERFPLLRFILADVPFQNMSLNEQYSDEEQRISKHDELVVIIWLLYVQAFANIWPQLSITIKCPVPSLYSSLEIMSENRKIWSKWVLFIRFQFSCKIQLTCKCPVWVTYSHYDDNCTCNFPCLSK